MKNAFVYILASKRNGTLYTGVTTDLIKRTATHKAGTGDGFSRWHSVKLLVYFEAHGSIREAILREKQIKKWNRKWKLRIIEEINPKWVDLYDRII